jgi:threonine dehydratase
MILTSRVYEAAVETPLIYAPRISGRLRVPVFLKREDLQPVFSFKACSLLLATSLLPFFPFLRSRVANPNVGRLIWQIRGAYNKMRSLSEPLLRRGVVACSAGNHAQGVALAASRLGVEATIVMPVHTPTIKVDAVRRLGARVVLCGSDFDEAKQECTRLSQAEGWTIIHPYDDPHVIAGQGTVGMEILRQFDSVVASGELP